MHPNYKRMLDYLTDLGIERTPHTEKTYLAHLIGLYKYLENNGYSHEICGAGMFHSIYGTEKFQGFKLTLEKRGEIRELIGERGERLAYLNCAMDRSTLDAAAFQESEPYHIKERTGVEVSLNRQDFDDLCRIHLYDWMEQVGRSKKWDYRRAAYRQMARRLGPEVEREYARVFAAEPAPSVMMEAK